MILFVLCSHSSKCRNFVKLKVKRKSRQSNVSNTSIKEETITNATLQSNSRQIVSGMQATSQIGLTANTPATIPGYQIWKQSETGTKSATTSVSNPFGPSLAPVIPIHPFGPPLSPGHPLGPSLAPVIPIHPLGNSLVPTNLLPATLVPTNPLGNQRYVSYMYIVTWCRFAFLVCFCDVVLQF